MFGLLQNTLRAASKLRKLFAVATTLKEDVAHRKPQTASTSAHREPPKVSKKERLTDIAFNNSLRSSAINIGETDYDDHDSNDNSSMDNTLGTPTYGPLSNNKLSLSRKEISRERKQKWNSNCGHINIRFEKFVKLCGSDLGSDGSSIILGKLGTEVGIKEYKSLLALCMEKSRETDDHDVQSEQNKTAYQIFQSMKEAGIPVEEEIYGPFLTYLIDAEMVQEFYFFSDIFKHENPDSLPTLAYYEMLLCIRLDNKDKIKQLLHDHSLYDGEDKQSFQESYWLALCGSDYSSEFLMLLETLDVTKSSSNERLCKIFKSLGMHSMDAYAEKFLMELKTSGTESDTLTSYIYNYALSIPNLTVEDAVSKFRQMHSEMEIKPTFTHYKKLIWHYCKSLKVQEAIDLANEMFNLGGTSSMKIIHAMLDACMESHQYSMGHQIYSMLRRQGLQPTTETFNSLISLTVRTKALHGAYDMLQDMAEFNLDPTVDIYNTIMAGLHKQKNAQGALTLLKQMEKTDVQPNSHTFKYIIALCQSEDQIVEIFDLLKNSGIPITKHVYMALIYAYATFGEFDKAKQVTLDDRIPSNAKNQVRNTLVAALASHGQVSDALTIYKEFEEPNCRLAPKAAICLMEQLQSEGQLDTLLQLQEKVKDTEYWLSSCYSITKYCIRHNHISCAIDSLKKIRDQFADYELAIESIFDEVFFEFVDQKPTDMKLGLELLRTIKEEMGLRPSRRVLDCLLDACVCANDLKAASFIWKEYQVAGLTYNILSFLRMYRTLLALGDLKTAEGILKDIRQDDPHISYLVKDLQATYLKDALPKKIEKMKKIKMKEKISKKKGKAATTSI